MSAVPDTFFGVPAAQVAPWLGEQVCTIAPFEPVRPVIGERGRAGAETLILERCAAQIAAEAGAGATVLPFGGGPSRDTAILEAAIEALPPACDGARTDGRVLVYVSGKKTAALPPDRLPELLRRIAQTHRSDVLLAVGVAVSCESACRPGALGDAAGHAYGLHRFDSLARAAGWEPCQVWTDARARFAIHVMAQPVAH